MDLHKFFLFKIIPYAQKKTKLIKYFLVGSIGLLSDYIITVIVFSILKNIFYSNFFGYIIGSVLSYIGHTKFTFKSDSRKLSSKLQILLFLISCINGIIISYLILRLLIEIGVFLIYAKIFQLIFIAVTQYLFNSKITFNLNKSHKNQEF